MHPPSTWNSRAHHDERLGPGRSAAPDDDRLVLLPSGPDTVRGSPLRGTRSSTSHRRAAFENGDLGRGFSPAGADCRYRAPLVPRLARPREGYPRRAHRPDHAVQTARSWPNRTRAELERRGAARSSGRRRPRSGARERPSSGVRVAGPLAARCSTAWPARTTRPSGGPDDQRLVAGRVARAWRRSGSPSTRLVVAGELPVARARRSRSTRGSCGRSCGRSPIRRPGRRSARPGTAEFWPAWSAWRWQLATASISASATPTRRSASRDRPGARLVARVELGVAEAEARCRTGGARRDGGRR